MRMFWFVSTQIIQIVVMCWHMVLIIMANQNGVVSTQRVE
nr:MAG TPA: hypothetical protein [Caudoviricetes sp.]